MNDVTFTENNITNMPAAERTFTQLILVLFIKIAF